MNVDLTIRGQIEALHLEPGDRIIVTLENRVRQAEFAQLSAQLQREFHPHRVIVLTAGLRLHKQTGAAS